MFLERKGTIERLQHCRHPKCESVYQIYAKETEWITCPTCSGRTCIQCDTVWHTNLTCEQYQRQRAEEAERKARSEEEQAATEYVSAHAKTCPKCQAPGEKVSGCDHMTCPRCKHEYCWKCFADYKEIRAKSNAGHTESCPYHSKNLPAHPGDVRGLAAQWPNRVLTGLPAFPPF